jgi:hypothetical protein
MRRAFLLPFGLIILVSLLVSGTAVIAQDDPIPPVERLVISSHDISSLPDIELRMYGRDAQGNPLDLTQETITISQDGTPAGQISVLGTHQVGTFTLFLIDIPPGVAGQLPALQEAINQFAQPQTMMEQVDSMAVYQVGATNALELLEPTNFHNSVRNLFASPLTPETGPTALYDSTGGLIELVESLKPNEEMAASIVLLTDGTDAVSTRFEANEVTETAVRAGIPIHTIWLNNENLSVAAQDAGQEYLASVAAGSGGIAVRMENAADLPLVWNRIAGFRDQTRVRYTVAGLTAGDINVKAQLVVNSAINTETTITIPPNIPSILINLPAESRTLSLPNLDNPVELSFSTTLSWLDEQEREVEAAQLVVNGQTTADIPVDSLDQFTVAIDRLAYGNNSIEVVILDSQGIRARSPEVMLTVNEGRRQIPTELNAGLDVQGLLGRVLLVAAILVIVAIMWFVASRGGLLTRLSAMMPRGRSSRPREPQMTITGDDIAPSVSVQPVAYLEVLEAATEMSSYVPLHDNTVKIGRSPAQADVAFEQDVTVSRLHATMMLEGNQYRIFDRESTSGTWVNDRQVPDYGVMLQDGDEIHMGAVHLRYRQAP